MMVQRKTAAKYLRMLVGAGFLTITKVKRVNYYINQQLVEVLMNQGKENDDIQ